MPLNATDSIYLSKTAKNQMQYQETETQISQYFANKSKNASESALFELRKTPSKLIEQWSTLLPKYKTKPIFFYLIIEAYYNLSTDHHKIVELYEKNKVILKELAKLNLLTHLKVFIGESYLRIGKYNECKAMLNEEREDASKNKRDVSILHETIGKCGYFLNDEDLIKSVGNGNVSINIMQVKLYFKQKRFEEAKKLLNGLLLSTKGSEEKDISVKLVCYLGDIYFICKNYKDALLCYREVSKEIELFKCNSFFDRYINLISFNVGKCLYNLCLYSEALEEFSKCTIPTFKLLGKYKLAASAKCSSAKLKIAYEETSIAEEKFISKFPEIKLAYQMDKYFVQYDANMVLPLKELMSIPNIPQYVRYILDSLCVKTLNWEMLKPYTNQNRQPKLEEIYNQAAMCSFMCDIRSESEKYSRLSLNRHLKLLRLMKLGGVLDLNCHNHCVLLMHSLHMARKCGIGNNGLIDDCKTALNTVYKNDPIIADILRYLDS